MCTAPCDITSCASGLAVRPSANGCLSIAFVEAALLCIWRLLSIARRGSFLTTRTVRWVNALILSLAADPGMLAAISAVLSSDRRRAAAGRQSASA